MQSRVPAKSNGQKGQMAKESQRQPCYLLNMMMMMMMMMMYLTTSTITTKSSLIFTAGLNSVFLLLEWLLNQC